MAESFSLSEFVVPGVFVRVRAEGLISAGGISAGNVGIVGTAAKAGDPNNFNRTYTLSDFEEARAIFGNYDLLSEGKLNLVRALEVLFRNGARTVYARALPLGANDAQPPVADYSDAFAEVVKEDVNILIVPQLSTAFALNVLPPLLETAENNGKDLIAVIGSDEAKADEIIPQVAANDRLIFAAPAIRALQPVREENNTRVFEMVDLPGGYTAAAVAGLISTLTPEASPTNKVLSGVSDLAQRFSYGDEKKLINAGVFVLEKRQGVRVVRGITTEMATNGPFKQVTTRRITDFAKAGIRQAANPFIGRLNNQRVRSALKGAIAGLLDTMVSDEQLIAYTLDVTATRQDEIAGRAIVNVVLQPTFSIDFIAVTLVLQ